MIRRSTEQDIAGVAEIYGKILEREPDNPMTGWKKGIYPTEQTALEAHRNGELFVMVAGRELVAAAIINHKQVREYADCEWSFSARDDEILVLHTLVVDPGQSGKGYATDFVRFYEAEGVQRDCRVLRLDTNAINAAARKLYQKLGYREAGIVSCDFNGLDRIRLVCLEKDLNT